MKIHVFVIILICIMTSNCTRKFDIYLPKISKSNSFETKKSALLQKEVNAYAQEISDSNFQVTRDRLYVYPDTSSFNKWNILNSSFNDIIIDYEKTYYIYKDKNYAVFPNKGKTGEKITNRVISPNETANISFYSPDLSGKFFDELVIAIQIDNKVEYVKVYWRKSIESFVSLDQNYIGQIKYVSTTENILCWATGIAYGGYCWVIGFSKPSEDDFKIVRTMAAERFNQGKNLENLLIEWSQ
jgi:hypothetical protein